MVFPKVLGLKTLRLKLKLFSVDKKNLSLLRLFLRISLCKSQLLVNGQYSCVVENCINLIISS